MQNMNLLGTSWLVLFSVVTPIYFMRSEKTNEETCQNLPKFKAVLRRAAAGDGFHRTLRCNFTVEFGASRRPVGSAARKFRFLVKEYFPSSMYVDPFQTGASSQGGRREDSNDYDYQLYFPGTVDIEKAADDTITAEQIVYVFQNECFREVDDRNGLDFSRWRCSYEVPFHLRYQKAAPMNDTNHFVEVLLPIPEMFVDYDQDSQHTKDCGHYFWTDVAEPTGTKKSRWLKLHLNAQRSYETSLKFRVPRGNPNLLSLVVAVTFLTVVFSCSYLVYTIKIGRKVTRELI